MVFHTGLSADEFAKQKRSSLLTLRGCVLREKDGAAGDCFSCEEWQAEGVSEENGLMAVYGRDVGGERLDVLLEGDKETALSAVLFWKAGLDFLRDKTTFEEIAAVSFIVSFTVSFTVPCAVFVDLANRTLFFPPRDLIRIVVENEGGTGSGRTFEAGWLSGAKRWTRPDKEGADAVNWTLAACLYRVFAGFAPFAVPVNNAPDIKPHPHIGSHTKPHHGPHRAGQHTLDSHVIEDTLAGDLREGTLIPAALAAPGLREDIVRFIDAHITRNAPKEKPPYPLIDRDYAKNIRTLPPEELALLRVQREAIKRKNQKQIRRKRFLTRNKTLIRGVAAGVIVLGLVAGSFVQAQLERWSTKGLTPAQVLEQYYGAFGSLDHETMRACLEKGAGKTDVEMVTNLFVIAKMREAYEQKQTVLNAADWDGSAPPPDTIVFGVVALALDWPGGGERGGPENGPVTARARYDLVVPQVFVDGGEDSTPARVAREDTLHLQWQKNRWCIAGIDRREWF